MAGTGNQQAQPRLEWTRHDSIFLAVLLIATFLCFAPALRYDFVYDDRLLILRNPQLLSWKFVPLFFREHFIAPVFPQAPANYYRPLLLLWMLANFKVWGAGAVGWHFASIALHLVVTAEIFFVARRVLPGRFSAKVAAAVFALHPIHVECVAWIMGMTESFGAMFFLASLLCYLRARDWAPLSRAWYGASLAFFACALLSKENMIVLPAVLVAWEWFANPALREDGTGGWIERCLRRLVPAAAFFAAAFCYLGLRLVLLGALSHAAITLPLVAELATLPRVVASYFRLLVWPVGLSAFYDVHYVTSFASQGFVLPLFLVAVALAALALAGWKSRLSAFASVWMLVPMLPLLNLTVFPQGEIVHDRYLYLPSMGFALLAGLALGAIPERRTEKRQELSPRVIASGVLLGLLGAGAFYYCGFWRDNLTLFARGVAVAPENNLAANNLANEYVARGDYARAVPIYQRILERDPAYAMAVYNLGFCYYRMGRLDQAESYLGRAAMLNSGDADAYIHLGMTYLKMGRPGLAEPAVRRALALNPRGHGYHLVLGVILEQRGEPAAALQEYRAELALYPGEPAAAEQARKLELTLHR